MRGKGKEEGKEEGGVGEVLKQDDGVRMRYERKGEGGGEGGRGRGGRGREGGGREGGEWEQWCEEEVGGGWYERRDLSGCGEEEWREELERDGERVQGSLDLEAGRMVRAVEYELGGERGKRLLLVVHHLVVDGVSWRILLEDLERGYEQLRRGEKVSLGAKTSSYQEWAEGMGEYAKGQE